jgi:hypothetical protein
VGKDQRQEEVEIRGDINGITALEVDGDEEQHQWICSLGGDGDEGQPQ